MEEATTIECPLQWPRRPCGRPPRTTFPGSAGWAHARRERAGQRVTGSIRKFLQSRLRLLVNEEKSKGARPDQIHFLGFRLRKANERTRVEVHVSDRTNERMDAKIRELTPRVWGQSPTRCIERLNVSLRGWSGYFRICTEESVYRLHVWDAHIRRRLRVILVRRKK